MTTNKDKLAAFRAGLGKSTLELAMQSISPDVPEDRWPWHSTSDALIAAPRHRKLLLENEQVRVLEVTIGPGEPGPLHSHRWPSVLYIEQAADFREYDETGQVRFDSTQAPPIVYLLIRWQAPQPPHAIENVSQTVTIHLIRVEIKQ